MSTESRATPQHPPDRAQLLYALVVGGRDALSEAAGQMGYVYRPRRRAVGDGHDTTSSRPETRKQADQPRTPAIFPRAEVELEPMRFWRPVAREYREDLEGQVLPLPEPSTTEAVEPGDLEPPESAAPRHEPLSTWPRLWRVLEDRLRTPRPRRAIDVDRLVRCWARGQTPRSLPRCSGLAHAPLTVLLDSSERLMPFWRDQMLVLGRLAKKLGRRTVRRIDAAPLLAGKLPVLGAEERVLALSDLGCFGSPETRQAWATLGARLSRRSVAPPVALVSASVATWPGSAARWWQALPWESPGRGGEPRGVPDAGSAGEVDSVLVLASVAQRLDAGLVRGLRRLVGADLGLEVELWSHPAVIERSAGGLVLEAETAKQGRRAFEELPVAEKAAVARLLQRWHGALPEILATEVADLLACGVGEEVFERGTVERSLPLLAQICRRVAREHGTDPVFDLAVDAFFQRFGQWSSLRLWHDPRLRADLERAATAHRLRYPETERPTGTTPEMLRQARTEGAGWHRHRIVQGPDGLGVGVADSAGSPLIELVSRQAPVVLADGLGPATELRPGVGQAPPCVDPIHLATDVEAVAFEAWQPILDDATSWASAAGRDEYGLWAAFEVEGVRQRLRWIPPGRFWMGSPESEPGRWNDEGPRHPVTLGEGFWLAETPCTQALWQAVMGGNPSHFKGSQRPVEQVRWDDCQRFLDRLNQRFRHLDARLPTEAEWEYACRAGTATATWRGELESSKSGEAKILQDIAWYRANSDGETHPVATREPNPWGLYDLLGNVLEWCWDYWGGYRGEGMVDPEGPNRGSRRVVRGGSWDDPARLVRAAYRFASLPGVRYSILGFRLSRGRGPGRGGAKTRLEHRKPESAVSGAAVRGTSRRARSRRSRAWIDRLGWANDGGTDVFGRWASFEVGGVVTRLRWLCPGTFEMGSPEEEEGRYDGEGPCHEVTLTQGFWLAETPCTQDLWTAVMGTNPSEFCSPRRPVEKVSWHDVQEFLVALDQQLPGLEPRLPTEAWWEYACRAGTATATWLGDLKIAGENNAPLLDKMAWYGGNSGVGFDLAEGWDSSEWPEKQYHHLMAGTRQVASKQPNPWGLYDMLGNVWEWCNDYWAAGYPEGPRSDPTGPEEGPGRVFRGGSWDARARGVRAACRDALHPDERYSYLGFRLSRGRGS